MGSEERQILTATPLYISTIMISSKHTQIKRLSIILRKPKPPKQHTQMDFKYLNFQIDRLKSILPTEPKKLCKWSFSFYFYSFPDGTIKCIFADGEEESIFTDGTIQRIEKNGVKAIEYASGQKDILFPDGLRVREYPDGRVKKTYPDGTVENTVKE